VGIETIYLPEFMNKINKEIDESTEHSIRAQLEEQIITKLLELNSFDIPKSLIADEQKRLLSRYKQTNQQLEQAISIAAKRNVQRAILLDSVYESEKDAAITPLR